MPLLPSGRRIEFSLDRFHTLLRQMESAAAHEIAEALNDPDDLLHVLDAVHFSLDGGTPFFAGYVASDWISYAAEWTNADRQAMREWLTSATARHWRAEAIGYIRMIFLGGRNHCMPYPYVALDGIADGGRQPGAMLLQ